MPAEGVVWRAPTRITATPGSPQAHIFNEHIVTHYCPSALTIAGSDSCGGAGIQADIKTMSAIGVYAMSAITAITAQNTLGVESVAPVAPGDVAAQIDAVAADIRPQAVKTGMLFNRGTVLAVARALRRHSLTPLVVDPVMISTSGHTLLDDDAVTAMTDEIFPLATIITPNKHEAERIAGLRINGPDDAAQAAEAMLHTGAGAVLIKGGHFHNDIMTDYLFTRSQPGPILLSTPRVDTQNTHGTGCTLSAAIAAYLALGNGLETAVRLAKKYLCDALASGARLKIGHGHGPVNHLFNPQKLHTNKIS